MLNRTDVYVDLRGQEISLANLEEEELELVSALESRAESQPNWIEFENLAMKMVAELYDKRGVPRSESRRTIVYRIARDLCGRIAVAAGMARAPDYRDELEDIIRTQFTTRRQFCEVTGLSEDMLSHVLAHRKHMSIERLVETLRRVGYELRITPRTNGEFIRPNGGN
jgi:hypothetical protein